MSDSGRWSCINLDIMHFTEFVALIQQVTPPVVPTGTHPPIPAPTVTATVTNTVTEWVQTPPAASADPVWITRTFGSSSNVWQGIASAFAAGIFGIIAALLVAKKTLRNDREALNRSIEASELLAKRTREELVADRELETLDLALDGIRQHITSWIILLYKLARNRANMTDLSIEHATSLFQFEHLNDSLANETARLHFKACADLVRDGVAWLDGPDSGRTIVTRSSTNTRSEVIRYLIFHCIKTVNALSELRTRQETVNWPSPPETIEELTAPTLDT